MLIIGLTGSIGMGKSTVAKMLRGFGFPVYCADKVVHAALKKGGEAVIPVSKLFPEALKRESIDRRLLARAVFGNPKKLRQLEKILHPLTRKAQKVFLQKARSKKARAAVLEIPLLFEIKAENACDVVFCVMAPRAVQKARVMSRPHMTQEKLRAILARQMPDSEKRKKADVIIPTGVSKEATLARVRKTLSNLGLIP